MNSVNIIGRLGADPESRSTQGGDAVTNFRIAVDEGFGDKKRTNWFQVVAWKKTAEFVSQYVKKGHRVAVSGRLQQREWEKDGQKRSTIEIVAERVDSLEPKKNSDSGEDAGF